MPATTDINTPERLGIVTRLPVAAATRIFAGTLAALNSSGYLVPASNTPGLVVMGRAEQTVDNLTGVAGDANCDVKRGIFAYTNSATNPVTLADIGKAAYVEDDATVASTGDVPAGRIFDVDAQGIWVEVVPPVISTDTLSALTFTTGGVTGPEAAALRDAIVNILTAAGLIR